MTTKPGVSVAGLQPEALYGLMIVQEVFRKANLEMTVTSVTDGMHSAGSLHYIGHAFDLRLYQIPQAKLDAVIAQCRERLPDSFDVVMESDHIHIEHQPKKQRQ